LDRSAPGPGRTTPRRCTHQLPRRTLPSSSLFLFDLLDAKVRTFNPCYTEFPGDLISRLRQFHATIQGNRDFVELLSNHGKFFDQGEKCEHDLILIDYDDALIDHFGDSERLKAFFKVYKDIEMLYEIIAPDAFLRPYLRELRQEITFALVAACEQLDQVTPLVEALFSTLTKGTRLE
jgi:hypothetical protein